MTTFVVFHQWLKKYSKRHKYSKTYYVATKPTETYNPSPASIQLAPNLIFHIVFWRAFFCLFIVGASFHYDIDLIWLISWIRQLNTDANTDTMYKIDSSFSDGFYYQIDNDFPCSFYCINFNNLYEKYVFAIRLKNSMCLWNIVDQQRLIKTMISEIQKVTWWAVIFQYSTETTCLRDYSKENQRKTVAKNETRSEKMNKNRKDQTNTTPSDI